MLGNHKFACGDTGLISFVSRNSKSSTVQDPNSALETNHKIYFQSIANVVCSVKTARRNSCANLRYHAYYENKIPPARFSEFGALSLGRMVVDPPVVLAPMAGITNAPFRQICKQQGAGLCVSEMVVAHLLAKGNQVTERIASFAANESPRSIQLYGIDVASMREATKILTSEGRVDHIDLNFGCPVRKIVSKGGGAAIPENPRLVFELVQACVVAAEETKVPVTVKMRTGITNENPTFLMAGRAAQDAGAAWVALHARSAEQLFTGEADWSKIAELANSLSIPVLGNGDVFECWDALSLMRQTGAKGVVIGRGCLGRPWIFQELAAVFAGNAPDPPPSLSQVLSMAHRHVTDLATWHANDVKAVLQMRKLVPFYLYGFKTTKNLQGRLMQAKTVLQWESCIAEVDFNPEETFQYESHRHPRLKGS